MPETAAASLDQLQSGQVAIEVVLTGLLNELSHQSDLALRVRAVDGTREGAQELSRESAQQLIVFAEGNQARSNEAAIAKYNEAEDVLLEDMPILPMFFQVEQSIFSEHVSNVQVDLFGRVDAAQVTVAD